jgi:aspartate kinase
MEATQARAEAILGPLLDRGVVPVVTGFIGADMAGAVTTLGRGGSDYSAAILGVALRAAEVWIWTDVDGVMTADPRVVKDARSLEALTYREVAELAYYGAKVLHPKTIRPVVESGGVLRIKNTFNPAHPGTRILEDGNGLAGAIKAVTAIKSLSLITVEGRGMMGVPGVAARAFGATARTHTSVLMISQASSEQSICFLVPSASAGKVVAAIEQEFALELARRDIDRVWDWPGVVIVTAVGAGMRYTPGVAGRVFSALGAAGINVIAIAQGSSECSISLVVDARDSDAAVRAVHELTGK